MQTKEISYECDRCQNHGGNVLESEDASVFISSLEKDGWKIETYYNPEDSSAEDLCPRCCAERCNK